MEELPRVIGGQMRPDLLVYPGVYPVAAIVKMNGDDSAGEPESSYFLDDGQDFDDAHVALVAVSSLT
jgi:hypothetical protein